MTDPRDEALRACVRALEDLYSAVAQKRANLDDYLYYKPAMYAAHDALDTARAALEAPTRRTDDGS